MTIWLKRLTILLALLSPTGWAADQPLPVVATFSILGDIVKTVGGPDVAVTTLVGVDGDAHVYEPTPADARAISGAKLVIVNGLGFEGWMDRLIQASGYKGTIAVASEGVKPLTMEDEDHDHDHGKGDDKDESAKDHHDHGGIDPHAWQDVANGKRYVDNIVKALSVADPDRAGAYRQRADAYLAELNELDGWVRQQIATVPKSRRRVITSHDAFGYFGNAYGVQFLSPVGWNTESEPSARAVARLIRQIRQQGVRALFIENISDPRLIQRIAREARGVVGGTLYSDALSPPGTPGESYLSLFRHNVTTLVAGMQRNPAK